jgi:hypothetical protein
MDRNRLIFLLLCLPVVLSGQLNFPISSLPGSSGKAFYNNSGSLSTVANVSSNGTDLLLDGVTTIPTGVDNVPILVAESVGNEAFPAVVDGSNPSPKPIAVDRGSANITEILVFGNGTTSVTTVGNTLSVSGTASSPFMDFSQIPVSMFRRLQYASTAATNSPAGFRMPTANLVVNGSSSTSGGGFRTTIGFGISALTSSTMAFIGVWTGTSAMSVAPSSMTNIVGVGIDPGDSNLHLFYNDGSGAATKTSLGTSFGLSTSPLDFYRLTIVCARPTVGFHYQLINLRTNSVTSGFVSSNIPTLATNMSTACYVNTGTSSTANSIQFSHVYAEGF